MCVCLVAEQSITATPTQAVVFNGDIDLECSSDIPGTTVTWDDPFPGSVMQASLEDQGDYECLIIEIASGIDIYTATIELQVIGMYSSVSPLD